MDRPITTLFMLMSLDGKISTGGVDVLDVDKDFPRIAGIREGLKQYYDLEQTTDLYSLSSGRTQAKVGVNERQENIAKTPVSFLTIDNKPHLTDVGVDNLIRKSKRFFVITSNKSHPVYARKDEPNVVIFEYKEELDFKHLFRELGQVHGVERLTIQTGGTLTSHLLRAKLIDRVSIVVAPALIGGQATSTLVDGSSLTSADELKHVKALQLVEVMKLSDSYIHLLYDVVNDTQVD